MGSVYLGGCFSSSITRCTMWSRWRTENSFHKWHVFEHLRTVDLLIPSQEQRYGLHGAEAVGWHALMFSVLFPGGHRCQLHHQIHDTLHRGGLLQPHLFHLHLGRHQENGWVLPLLSHQHWLPARLHHGVQVRMRGARHQWVRQCRRVTLS